MRNAIIIIMVAIAVPLYANFLTFGEIRYCIELGLSSAFSIVIAGLIIGLILPTYKNTY